MKRVLIVSTYPLFGQGLENLLRGEEEFQIVGREKDINRAIDQVRTLQPDVVIVDTKDREADRGKIMMQIIQEGLQTLVVGLDLSDDKVYFCRGEQKHIEELGDFLGALKSKSFLQKGSNGVTSPLPARTVIRDRFGRVVDYMRISITDRCNLRCVYCMPPAGVPAKPRDAILHSEEIARIVEAAAGIGFRTIRLTGGEPLVRKGMVGLVRRVAAIPGIEQVTLTTNATLLNTFAQELKQAGLKRVNISLDSMQPTRFRRITRSGNLEAAWKGIEAAEAAGLTPLKINVVVIRGFNDDEVADFARLTLYRPWHIRFIEVMPIAGVADWGSDMPGVNERLVTVAEMQQRLKGLGPLLPVPSPEGQGPARYYSLPGAQGTVGFISAVSEHFCASCNRLRLTADGYLRPCLFSDQGLYIKPALDSGASLNEIQTLIRQAIDSKPEQHGPAADMPVAGTAMSMIGG